MCFSPRKFRTSMREPPSEMAVDGEVSIHSPHLVTESQGDSLEKVLDVRADGPDGSQLLLLTKPSLNPM